MPEPTDEKQPKERPKTDWKGVLQHAVKLADEDPEKFRNEMKILAKRLGVSLEQLYQRLQKDPDFPKREAVDKVIQLGARKIREALKL